MVGELGELTEFAVSNETLLVTVTSSVLFDAVSVVSSTFPVDDFSLTLSVLLMETFCKNKTIQLFYNMFKVVSVICNSHLNICHQRIW